MNDINSLIAELSDTVQGRVKAELDHLASLATPQTMTAAEQICSAQRIDLEGLQGIQDVQAALASEVKSPFGVILTSQGTLAVLPFVTAQLDDVLRFDPKAGKLIAVADLRAIAGVPETRAGGRSNDYENPIRELRALRTSQGPALQGRNAEAKALQAELEKQFTDMKCPSLPTVKRYVSEVRSGS
ncbi:hypothetical protein HKX54_01285 [Sulfitobacter sp. M57]|uniref:hypothetical protein n=1 Tax=unclassified Sulfitobacter TaxID=196795 RepID=UPI0023E1A7D3|nr:MULTISPECIES: hypothetical protein [unclassified Sulfitobacter]MDF3413075.1 hypothetical protein [Sulfitobacter sp. KE5]MDF3421642.1 hypothetical protein [Sulfitobacter sp. KE43]MDF3431624.1 hypothetical protein [Sulfitobacter sp. KE42]MDF3457265.1 hypothetical protein [Sulfitobacter sp. S74]MDF3461167.1 hypothetical protein [Sulfitobacter sp. Ks18]